MSRKELQTDILIKKVQNNKEIYENVSPLIKQRIRNRKRRRRNQMLLHIALCCSIVVILLCVSSVAMDMYSKGDTEMTEELPLVKTVEKPSNIREDLLTINAYSRPGTKLKEVKGIVVHYTGNPGTTAQQNRNYFEGLAETKKTKASSHYIIGLDGEIIQCVPLNEIAYASNERNSDTISIECCIEDETGKFNEKTYESLVKLTSWLMGRYQLQIDTVIRHHDVTGKICPKYFVEHESAWLDFKSDVEHHIEIYGTEK